MAYKARRDIERGEALDEMIRISQEMGLYDLDFEGTRDWREETDETATAGATAADASGER